MKSIRDLFPLDVQARLAYRDYLRAEARARGLTILHRPYCGCESSWLLEKCYRDPGCEEL